jgi:hypothetical protein
VVAHAVDEFDLTEFQKHCTAKPCRVVVHRTSQKGGDVLVLTDQHRPTGEREREREKREEREREGEKKIGRARNQEIKKEIEREIIGDQYIYSTVFWCLSANSSCQLLCAPSAPC